MKGNGRMANSMEWVFFTFADGRKYTGMYVNGKPHDDDATYTFADGSTEKCKYVDGVEIFDDDSISDDSE